MLRFTLAVLAGKLALFVGRLVHRSTVLPGEVALKICPDFFKHLKVQGKIIAVTGSNGKTTTANLIAHILRSQGYKVRGNAEGANIVTGAATVFLAGCSLSGRMEEDFVVLEVDERHARLIFADLTPEFFLLNNLLRDQVVRNGHPDIILEKISMAIRPGVTLVLNGDDPISQRIHPENPRVYFGMGRTQRSTEECPNITHDCKVCPQCFHPLHYDFYHYNHIGQFSCPNCGYCTPKLDYLADQVDFQTGDFTINGLPAHVTYKTPFHVLNTTGAVGLCHEAGVPLEAAIAAAGTFEVSRERFEEFDVKGRKAVLLLTKQNPVSLDQNISYVLAQPEEKTVALFVNNVIYMDNKDISWLYDVSFERLKGQVNQIVCGGSRAYDVAVRLKLAGFTDEELVVEAELGRLCDAMMSTAGTIYVLAASAFGKEDGILEVLRG